MVGAVIFASREHDLDPDVERFLEPRSLTRWNQLRVFVCSSYAAVWKLNSMTTRSIHP